MDDAATKDDGAASADLREELLRRPNPDTDSTVDLGDPSYLETVIIWVGGAIGAGVIGNAAYDTLKAGWARLRLRSRKAQRAINLDSYSAVVQLARVTLYQRLADAGFEPIPDGVINIVRCERNERGWLVAFSGRHIRAWVRLPASPETDGRVPVEVEVGSIDFRGLWMQLHTLRFVDKARGQRPGISE